MCDRYNNPEAIYSFLKSQQAPERLIKHHQLVVETAEEIILGLKDNFPNLDCNYSLVLIGSAIHDAGKIIFNNEIVGAGNRHELAGEKYLIDRGIPPKITRFSRTHARWYDSDISLEDLLVALADKLWKGCRNEKLETLVIKKIAQLIGKDFWDIFILADSLFETVSDRGMDRLNRSVLL